jgi:beta-glucosidase
MKLILPKPKRTGVAYINSKLALWLALLLSQQLLSQQSSIKNVDKKVDSVLKLMTLEEKVGQLNQYARDFTTGTVTEDRTNIEGKVKQGSIGSFLNLKNIDDKIKMQEWAMKSRLKIPLIYGFDVIHGHQTIFPIPLAQAASWDLQAIEKVERIAATEAAADGINWTFAPMVDITHDPRWGRIMEGSGEDPYLGSLIAEARIKGFQGTDLSLKNTIAACAKHFAAYGFAEGGRDYNTVDIGTQQLRNIVLPPFKAASDAGVATFMNSFNILNGVPASMNTFLLRDILKGEWCFNGFVVSDWNSFGEILNHGAATNRKDIAYKVMTAGSDMDMEGRVYEEHLAALVNDKKINIRIVDDAVRRVLRIKFMLGLFDNPFKYLDKKYREETLNKPEFVQHSKEMAQKSMVLLKNDWLPKKSSAILPLNKTKIKKIVVVGPLANGTQEKDYMSFWTLGVDTSKKVITPYQGLANKFGDSINIIGYNTNDKTDLKEIRKILRITRTADVVIVAVGEHGINNGEARSFANLALPESQKQLLQALKKQGRPVVTVLFTGRAIVDKWLFDNMPCILNAWQPGQEAGSALTDVLFGDYNPSGKLPFSWPRSVGQIPVYYNHHNTGRPKQSEADFWVSRYRDESNEPQFPFGYGLSYSKFSYTQMILSDTVMRTNGNITVTLNIKNESEIDGEEIAQLYIRDIAADISRPVKELKAFEKVLIKAGETKLIQFTITENDLKYWNHNSQYKSDSGLFQIMVGTNSNDVQTRNFELKK